MLRWLIRRQFTVISFPEHCVYALAIYTSFQNMSMGQLTWTPVAEAARSLIIRIP